MIYLLKILIQCSDAIIIRFLINIYIHTYIIMLENTVHCKTPYDGQNIVPVCLAPRTERQVKYFRYQMRL